MRRIKKNGLVFYQFERLNGVGGLRHGVFTRLGGVSKPPFDSLNVGSTVGDDPASVLTNRRRMAQALNVREAETRTTWQVHGAEVIIARRDDPEEWPPPQADAIVTAEVGLPLVMRFADCVPLVLYDPARRVLALAHAGWRGTVAGVAPAVVRAMQEAFGCRPPDIIVGIGPSIGPERYEVGPEVAARVRAVFGDEAGLIERPAGNGSRPHLNLWEANRRALQRVGVRQIEVAGICTASNTREFYSHRAENGRTGRFGLLAVLEDV